MARPPLWHSRARTPPLKPMRTATISLLLACLLALAPSALVADDEEDLIDLRSAVREGRIVPLEQILEDALKRVPGRVVDIDLDLDEDEYEIEVLDADGVVWELEYSARTGELREIERD